MTIPGDVLLPGLHACKHALRFDAPITRIVTSDRARVLRLAADLAPDVVAALDGRMEDVDPEELADLAGGPLPTPVLGTARRPTRTVEDVLAPGRAPAVALERPRHAGNLGAVVRVAAAAGAAGVVTVDAGDPWAPAAVRGGAGLQFALPVAGPVPVAALIATAREAGRPLVAVHPDDATTPLDALPDGALLAFGTERHGLSAQLLAAAEHRVAIAMRPRVSSLNLATAVAVTLYGAGAPFD